MGGRGAEACLLRFALPAFMDGLWSLFGKTEPLSTCSGKFGSSEGSGWSEIDGFHWFRRVLFPTAGKKRQATHTKGGFFRMAIRRAKNRTPKLPKTTEGLAVSLVLGVRTTKKWEVVVAHK